MLKQTFITLFAFSLALPLVTPASLAADASNQVQQGEMAGYLLVPNEKVPVAWNSFATPMAADPNTFGFRWDPKFVEQTDSKPGPLV